MYKVIVPELLPADREHHKLAIAGALRELDDALALLLEALTHEPVLVSAEQGGSERAVLKRICDAYAAIRYERDQAVNETVTVLGVVGAPATVVSRANDVNAAKARLRDACVGVQNQRVRVPVKDGQGGRVVKSLPLVRVLLRELQASDLNLLAAYRKIPVLTGRPDRVAYVRAQTRSVYRKSRADIAAMLDRLGERPGVDADRARLARLPEHETHLALVDDRYANVRANVRFHGLDSRNRGRVQVSAELPLLYPLGRSKELPEIKYPDAAEEGARPETRPRAGKLEPRPFLDTLPVYRYRSELRSRTRR
jgi:hypothetical protein